MMKRWIRDFSYSILILLSAQGYAQTVIDSGIANPGIERDSGEQLVDDRLSAVGASAAKRMSLDGIEVIEEDSNTIIRFATNVTLPGLPRAFSASSPPRVILDFPGILNNLDSDLERFSRVGLVLDVNAVQGDNRTRVIINLRQSSPYDMRVADNSLIVVFKANQPSVTSSFGSISEGEAIDAQLRSDEATFDDGTPKISNIRFRRDDDGNASINFDLSKDAFSANLQRKAGKLYINFSNVNIASRFLKLLDVRDFATPVSSVEVKKNSSNVTVEVSSEGNWEYFAYQVNNQFTVEVKKVILDPDKMVQSNRPGYQGEKLSLNFQNVDVRAVMEVIADFTNLNIIVSDTVTGTLTLRLRDIPWDQAFDIILTARGLDKRKNGTVVWVAPRQELADRDKLMFDSRNQLAALEPTRTESFQVNYHKASAIAGLLQGSQSKGVSQTAASQTSAEAKIPSVSTAGFLSVQGSVIVDERSNKLFVTDTDRNLETIASLIAEIDVPARQVLIEARIVEASDNFQRDLGVRLGLNNTQVTPSQKLTVGGGINSTGFATGQVSSQPAFNDTLGINLPAAVSNAGRVSVSLFNRNLTKFVNLELSALVSDGNGKTITSPRVLTADKVGAVIEQGVQVPFQEASSSGATSISFQKATLSLKVTPNITPDGRVRMELDVNKDEPDYTQSVGGSVPINTKHVQTEALVENGGTVVIGGIFEETTGFSRSKVPLLGDLPIVGYFFRSTKKVENRKELLVFITPRIVSDNLNFN